MDDQLEPAVFADALPAHPTTDPADVEPDVGDAGGELGVAFYSRGAEVAVSGRSEEHRAEMRRIIVAGCELMLRHPESVHYSQGPDRWEGITQKRLISKKQFPFHSDCSANATWLHWNAHVVHFPDRPGSDVLSFAHWAFGWTGTLALHGKQVMHDENVLPGDLILYGQGPPFKHVAVALGGGLVFSHGSEGGPYKLDMDYRSDRGPTRRYI
jgi:cell wall-associated NlpC family hydrolase